MTKGRNFETDFLDFIKLCNEHNVKYLVIGGFAVSIHGYPRYTKDLDICIALSEENAQRMTDVISDFGFASLGLTKEDFLSPDIITQLGHEPVRIDILNNLGGVSFDIAWANKKMITYEGIEIAFIGYNDLLTVKEKTGRPQDLTDIVMLKKRNKKK